MIKAIRIPSAIVAVGLLGFDAGAAAEPITPPASVPAGQTFTVQPEQSLRNESLLRVFGTLNNQGKVVNESSLLVSGTFNNYGNFFQSFASWNPGGQGAGKIINHPGANMVFTGYHDMYGANNQLENFGDFSFIEARGGDGDWGSGFLVIQGTIKNHGRFLLNTGNNACSTSDNYTGTINNDGTLEIRAGTTCTIGIYHQAAGETIVNGTLSGTSVAVNGGRLSGSGTVVGLVDFPLFNQVNVAPGAPFGTLTLEPSAGYQMCVGCSMDFDLAGASGNDQLHINGYITLNDPKINVVLRNGYTPAAGTSFVLVSADDVTLYGPPPTYNLPQLPNGRTWGVQNTGTTITLTAN